MCKHCGNQARVMRLLSSDLMLDNKFLPLNKDVGCVWQQRKCPPQLS